MEVQLEKEVALIETVLFLEAEPMDEAALARATDLAPDVVALALEALREEYAAPIHGLEPVQSGGGWILAPKVELWEVLKDRYGKKADSRLSRAALETLSIIAYSQPITRAEIESLRGVSADGMVHFLLEKELIKEVGKKEAPGRPVQYGTTKEFLKYFRLGSIADLPKLDELDRERFDDEDAVEAGEAAAEEAEKEPEAQGKAPEGEAGPGGEPPAAPSAAPAEEHENEP
jgi:segregation and condensation protein B